MDRRDLVTAKGKASLCVASKIKRRNKIQSILSWSGWVFFCCIHSCKIFRSNNVAKIHSFAWMLFKRSHIGKIVSAGMLVMLLLIHSIKLLHSHSSDDFYKDNHSAIVKSSSDCSICCYQLNKDADDLVYPSICEYDHAPISFNTQLTSFHKFSFHPAFENRGPPFSI